MKHGFKVGRFETFHSRPTPRSTDPALPDDADNGILAGMKIVNQDDALVDKTFASLGWFVEFESFHVFP